MMLNTLNTDLKQMTKLNKKSRAKRFLVEYQMLALIEQSIKE